MTLTQVDGSALPDHIIYKENATLAPPHPIEAQYMEINTTDSDDLGKWTLQAIISKELCTEIVEFEVEVDNMPVINLPTTITVYEDVKWKLNWGPDLIYDPDEVYGQEIIDLKFFPDKALAGFRTAGAVNTAGNLQAMYDMANHRMDWDPDLRILTVFDTEPWTIPMEARFTDSMDRTTWHYFNLVILPNTPPIADVAYTKRVHTLTSGQHFSFDFVHDFFTEVDAGDQIRTWYMNMDDGSWLPSWISFLPHTRTYLGTAKETQVQQNFTFYVWAKDTRGALSYVEVDFIINPNLPPVLNEELAEKYVIQADAFFLIQIPKDHYVDPEGFDVVYDKSSNTQDHFPSWMTYHRWNRTFTGWAP